MTLVVLSPHLDDAVLSAGGAMLTAAAAGERVVAVTLFSECDGGGERRAEDARALAMLGAEGLHLGLLDAPERLGLERSKRALCDAILDGADVDAVTKALSPVLSALEATRVLSPLAVGRHVDHRVVFEAARRVAAPRGLAYYEDRPYAFVAGATDARLAAVERLTASTTTYDDSVAERVRAAVMAYSSQLAFLVQAFGQATTRGVHQERLFVETETALSAPARGSEPESIGAERAPGARSVPRGAR